MNEVGRGWGGGPRFGRRAGRTRAVIVVAVAVASLAACSGGGGDAAKGATTTSRPATGQGDVSRPSFCQVSPDVRQSFSGNAKDPQALRAAVDAFIDWIDQTSEGAPEQVRKDLSYLVGRYQQVKDALAAGESPTAAAGRLAEQGAELAAAANTFTTYTRDRCQGTQGT